MAQLHLGWGLLLLSSLLVSEIALDFARRRVSQWYERRTRSAPEPHLAAIGSARTDRVSGWTK